MAKRRLTDRTIKAQKPAESGERYDIMDDLVTGFGVRVTDKAQKTFILVARYPGSSNPRTLGECGSSSPEQAQATPPRSSRSTGSAANGSGQ
jgi:hypothetical protein